jgi:SAM-dependent methyltransferase
MEKINRRTWRGWETLHWYAKFEGYLDPGERACFEKVAPEVVRRPALDLGVGGGRTAALLLALTPDYVGLDYTPQMVAICRRKFPGVRFEEGDARDLSRFATASFQLVTFSYNGIDAVDGEGRERVLREAWRVLRPDGLLFFSTLNLHGPDFRAPLKSDRVIVPTWNPLRFGLRVGRYVVAIVVGHHRRVTARRFEVRERDHAVLVHPAHDFGVLLYATSLSKLRAQLAAHGYAPDPEIIGARSGKPVRTERAVEEPYFHVIARKPRHGPWD